MALTSKQRHDLKKLIKELEGYRGSHTELVSVYIPSGYDMNKVINHLQQEQGTAENIKSTGTRKNVIDEFDKEGLFEYLTVSVSNADGRRGPAPCLYTMEEHRSSYHVLCGWNRNFTYFYNFQKAKMYIEEKIKNYPN